MLMHPMKTTELRASSSPRRMTGEQAVAKGSRTKLVFEARFVPDAGALADIDIAVRVVNGWYQHWSYGNAGSYRVLHVQDQWKTLTVSLENRSDCWWWFKSDGNKYYGPEHPDLGILAGVVLEFGGKKKDRPGPGRGTISIRNIRLE